MLRVGVPIVPERVAHRHAKAAALAAEDQRRRRVGRGPPARTRACYPDRAKTSVIETNWRLGTPGHLRVSVPLEEASEVERDYAAGRRVNLFADGRASGWIRVLELRRVDERGGEVEYLPAFAACEPPAPPN